MSSFMKASKMKLRFTTNRGSLSTEQLWDLPLTELDTLAVELEESYKNSKGKSFLTQSKTRKDRTIKLQFDIVLQVLQAKLETQETAQKAAETKAHNQKILGMIQDRKDQNLKEMTVEELEGMLK